MNSASRKKSSFESFDEYINSLVLKIQTSTGYIRFCELFSDLSDSQRKVLAQIGNLSIILFPLLLSLFVFISNISLKNEINSKKEVISSMNNFLKQDKDFKRISLSTLSSTKISNQKALEQKLTTALSSTSVNTSNIRVTRFDLITANKLMHEIEAEITYSAQPVKNIISIINTIQQRLKFKVLSLNIRKNNKTRLLSGKIKILHIGKGE